MAQAAEKIVRGAAMGVLLRRGLIAVLGGAGVGLSALGLGLAWQPKAQSADAPSPSRPLIIDGPPTDVPPAPAPAPPPRPSPAEPFVADMDDGPGPDAPPPVQAAAEAAAAQEVQPGEPDGPEPAAAGPVPTGPPQARADDCAALASPADRLVCATPNLVAADLRMRRLYRRALDGAADPEGLRDDQRLWDRDRDRVAQLAGPQGLAQLYDERIQQLSGPG